MGVKSKQKSKKSIEEKSAVDQVFERRKKIKAKFDFKRSQPLLFTMAILLGILVIGCTYYFSPISKVKAISVKGNYYLESGYIKEISTLTLENRYYLVFDYFIEKELEKSDMISSAKVMHKENGVIEIVVEEEIPYGYRYGEKGEILLKSGKVIELKSEYLDIIARVPFVDGFTTEEQTEKLARAFSKVDLAIIESISEVSQYPMTYDEETIRVFTRDGNNFFASYYSLEAINSYHQISSDIIEKGKCIYSDDSLKVAYTSKCPWEFVEEQKEYWIDELGNVVVNQYGDPVEKKYYTDGKGNFILDGNGNKILIPMGQEDNYEQIQGEN